MKKTVYTRPQAEVVLLNNYDVIQTSGAIDDNPIKLVTDDSQGLPTVSWKS